MSAEQNICHAIDVDADKELNELDSSRQLLEISTNRQTISAGSTFNNTENEAYLDIYQQQMEAATQNSRLVENWNVHQPYFSQTFNNGRENYNNLEFHYRNAVEDNHVVRNSADAISLYPSVNVDFNQNGNVYSNIPPEHSFSGSSMVGDGALVIDGDWRNNEFNNSRIAYPSGLLQHDDNHYASNYCHVVTNMPYSNYQQQTEHIQQQYIPYHCDWNIQQMPQHLPSNRDIGLNVEGMVYNSIMSPHNNFYPDSVTKPFLYPPQGHALRMGRRRGSSGGSNRSRYSQKINYMRSMQYHQQNVPNSLSSTVPTRRSAVTLPKLPPFPFPRELFEEPMKLGNAIPLYIDFLIWENHYTVANWPYRDYTHSNLTRLIQEEHYFKDAMSMPTIFPTNKFRQWLSQIKMNISESSQEGILLDKLVLKPAIDTTRNYSISISEENISSNNGEQLIANVNKIPAVQRNKTRTSAVDENHIGTVSSMSCKMSRSLDDTFVSENSLSKCVRKKQEMAPKSKKERAKTTFQNVENNGDITSDIATPSFNEKYTTLTNATFMPAKRPNTMEKEECLSQPAFHSNLFHEYVSADSRLRQLDEETTRFNQNITALKTGNCEPDLNISYYDSHCNESSWNQNLVHRYSDQYTTLPDKYHQPIASTELGSNSQQNILSEQTNENYLQSDYRNELNNYPEPGIQQFRIPLNGSDHWPANVCGNEFQAITYHNLWNEKNYENSTVEHQQCFPYSENLATRQEAYDFSSRSTNQPAWTIPAEFHQMSNQCSNIQDIITVPEQDIYSTRQACDRNNSTIASQDCYLSEDRSAINLTQQVDEILELDSAKILSTRNSNSSYPTENSYPDKSNYAVLIADGNAEKPSEKFTSGSDTTLSEVPNICQARLSYLNECDENSQSIDGAMKPFVSKDINNNAPSLSTARKRKTCKRTDERIKNEEPASKKAYKRLMNGGK